MDENQIATTAQLMFLQGKGRKDVIDFFNEKGITGEAAETQATNAYLAVKDKRQEMLEIESGATEEKGGGMGSILIGVLFLGGGIAATAASDSIWYGAMIVGVISIMSGIAKSV